MYPHNTTGLLHACLAWLGLKKPPPPSKCIPPDEDHHYQRSDEENWSPCPGLNALMNHGYL